MPSWATLKIDMNEEKVIPIELKDPEIAGRIEGRLVALLDMNVWIDLAEAKTEQNARLREKLRDLVSGARLFCPLTASLIWELYRQSFSSALRVATLMEELSLNTSFAATEEIFTSEVDAVFEELQGGSRPAVGPSELFVPVIAHISSHGELRFPRPSLFRNPQAIADQLVRECRGVGLVELCKMTRDSFSMQEGPTPALAATALRRREIAGESKEKARRIEEEAALRNFVTPRFIELSRSLPLPAYLEMWRRVKELPRDRYRGAAGHLLKSMPSITQYVNVFLVIGQDPGRKDKTSYFFDIELMTAPLAYSDIFVSWDRWIRPIVERVLNPTAVATKQCLWTPGAFENCLDKLAASGESSGR